MSTNLAADVVDSAQIEDHIVSAITDPRFLLLTAAQTKDLATADDQSWTNFAAEWDMLTPDSHMADGGTYRLRRYSRFTLNVETGQLTQLPHGPYRQSMVVNNLNGGIDRHFDPCTSSFCDNPVLQGLLPKLGKAFSRAHGATSWDIKLHPYRIKASATAAGKPAPEGRHRDGVTFIMTMMINRHQISGGESAVYTNDGDRLATLTLTSPGEILMGDDRNTTHSVTPIHPRTLTGQGHRDVLVIAFTAETEQTSARAGKRRPLP